MYEPGLSGDFEASHSGGPGRRSGRKLVPVKGLSYGEAGSGNMLIQGDNLDAMHLIAGSCAGKVRCAYLDPPYRNGERYTHYADDLCHEEWLEQVTNRIARVAQLLSDDGSLWLSIDDTEVHYLKVAMDRIFGRENFVTTVIWQQRTTRENRRVFSNNHEYLLVYAKNFKKFGEARHGLPLTDDVRGRYANPDNDPRGLWQSISANVQAGHAVSSQFYLVKAPNGRQHYPPNGRCWAYNAEKMTKEIAAGNVWFGKSGDGVPRLKKFLVLSGNGMTPETLWLAQDVGTNDHAKKHLHTMFAGEALFDTPKPEPLIARVLRIATQPGDLVLDPYLGSGTTAAVAMKTGRRFIGIESGDHASTLTADRLRQVVDGEAGGVSAEFGWEGGSGFQFHRVK